MRLKSEELEEMIERSMISADGMEAELKHRGEEGMIIMGGLAGLW